MSLEKISAKLPKDSFFGYECGNPNCPDMYFTNPNGDKEINKHTKLSNRRWKIDGKTVEVCYDCDVRLYTANIKKQKEKEQFENTEGVKLKGKWRERKDIDV